MRFMLLVKASKESEAGTLPTEAQLAEMGRFNEELVNAGMILAAEGLHSSAKGARVRFSGRKPTVIPGPFPEPETLVAGFWMLRVDSMEAAVELAKRVPFDDGEMVIRVNVSARQLTEPGLIATVTDALQASGLAPERLCLEVTESVVLEDGDRCVAALQALRDIGVGVSLDDFGTGYCSLSYLRRLPIDSLKIDRSFVRGLGSEADDDSIVTSVIDLARSLGVSVVAEGVETEEQLAGLRARGCDTMQGFLFARPGPASAVADLVAADARPATAAAA